MNNGCSTGEEDSRGPSNQFCCLIDEGERCNKVAGNASYSKRIQKIVAQRRLRLHIDDTARHNYICEFHKTMIQCARTKRRRKDSEEDSNGTDSEVPEVDLSQLQVNTLRRYKRHFKLQTRPAPSKSQLAEILMNHFKTISVPEKEVTTFFIYTVKSNGNKLDQKNGLSSEPV
ncbi:Hypothetical predicted protein [Cloeon dipterum]|uniref:Histone deacetylase complex subunit SAP30 Sin3 binding domain-containing protein n=3 Tax=Cloeon TaxID=197151 RepID=A0A8S1CZT4_9INSE|nr:Hypothetical predicted protein [Cloeon dipterum]